MSEAKTPAHPGTYVRQKVIPSGMSVKDAANRLGVGRPALSNFLNGNSALSPRMAARLEKAFGADRQQLLDMQAAFDRKKQREGESVLAVRAFVPHFLSIKARQLEDWADKQIEARTRLPVLLRILVHSTGVDLHRVDFPGYDDGQRKGNDGFVEAGEATPWIPEGKSYWEFGTDKRPSSKAECDYAARLKSVDVDERAKSTLVFVTPRKWPGKTAWESEKGKAGDWKAVRVFDASDLEQWLEQSVAAQIWLAEQVSIPIDGYETLEQAWRRWADATDPHLTPEIFAPSIATHRATFKEWLEKPSARPFVVAADSKNEALAFLACLFRDEELWNFRDLAAIFTSPATLKTLVASSVPFIPIVYSEAAERELLDAHRRLHCIVLRPRNAVDAEPDVALGLLNYEGFEKALVEIGIKQPRIERLARESGLSPTILRRRLSGNAAIRTPAWASDDETAKTLVPMAFVGAWHAEAGADREIMAYLAVRGYTVIEDDIARLLRFDDSPVWSAGRYRGVTSKIDALFAVAGMVTSEDLERFFLVAEYVLSESDPSLDLPEDQRWAAAVYGKTRNHSSALREGVCETLVILSVHGNNLFRDRLGLNAESRVAQLIRRLLAPLTLEKMMSQDHDLPRYAEAAPSEFLKILEADLQGEGSVTLGLLKPVDSGALFASPSRTGLLWALECLAWNPQNLPRVAAILAELSQTKINDNWANKPDATLQAIFSSWVPQTAAPLSDRIKALETLTKRYPRVCWDICIAQLEIGTRIGHYNYRPHWRNDASGSGQPVTTSEMFEFTRKALDLVLTWPSHDVSTLSDLISSLQGMPETDQARVWDLVEDWAKTADELSKAAIREHIRKFALTRRGLRRNISQLARDRAREAYDMLQPEDPVVRHAWLFADSWVQESAEELENSEGFDYRKRVERISELRRQAIAEVWSDQGFEGIKELLITSGAPAVIGHFAASHITTCDARVCFVHDCLAINGDPRTKGEDCLRGFLASIEDQQRNALMRDSMKKLSDDDQGRLFECAPFCASTWRLLDEYGDALVGRYWKGVWPHWGHYTQGELTELIDRLLEARRPRAAFHAAHLQFEDVETSQLKRMLNDVAKIGSKSSDRMKIESYDISRVLDSLDGRPGVTVEEMSQLEFMFMGALRDREHGIPNLEAEIAKSPELFVQAVALAYKRSDGLEDPPQWRIEAVEQREAVAGAAYRLLDQVKITPGTNKDGTIDAAKLTAWLLEVGRLCNELGRSVVGDHCIGHLLAKTPADSDGAWPPLGVCEAMERIASAEIGSGFLTGVYNSRGMHSRGEGGSQERELASKYVAIAERLRFEFPYVAGLFDDLADGYIREASREDSEARIQRRLGR